MMEERAPRCGRRRRSSCRPPRLSAGPGPTGRPRSRPCPGPGAAGKGAGGEASPGPRHEWARFEAEKARWEAERAELQAQVAFLQGERKGQENLKTDLVRRIKMLEYALKQERAKYHKLKFGTDLNQGEKKADVSEQGCLSLHWPLQYMKKYLEEVGYTDTILDMRSKRVRSLLGRSLELNGAVEPSEGTPRAPPGPAGLSGGESLLVKQIEEQIKRNASGKDGKERLGGSVLGQIPFLQNCEDEDSDEDDELDSVQHKKQRVKLPSKALVPEMEDEDEEDDSEDAINEFDFLGSGEDGEGAPDPRRCAVDGSPHELESRRVKLQGILADLRDVDGLPPKVTGPPPGTPQPRPHEGSFGFSSDVFIMDTIGGGEVSLGDLADLTVTNDNDLSCDLSDSKDAFKKTWNPKFTLRSHYDGIRSLAFHHSQSALLTASEDGTLKLWNLQKAVTAKNLSHPPFRIFVPSRGPVLAVAMGSNSEYCYSGGADACIHSWKIPDLSMDPYDGYDPSVLSHVLEGHGDAVWGLAFSPASQRLASCSADGTVRIWDPSSSSPACLCTFPTASEHGVPTSVAFTSTDPAHIVASFRSGDTVLYDLEAGGALLTLESRGSSGPTQINQVVSHPNQPLTITAHDDRGIRFLDNRTGESFHSLSRVTCLAVDPNGAFLMSGSHDCSLRLWSLDNKTCVQEITAHRKKHEEAIHAVACHPSKALIASAGADALAKVFV
uniref:Striatin 4 n=1 Tax=Macaca nemestrina TaxID=9545 RepID=A0A2K6DTJ2_MACNE